MPTNQNRLTLAVVLLFLLLAASLVGNAFLYSKANRPLFLPSDVPLIERTHILAAAISRSSIEEVRQGSFPLVIHTADRICVELRAADGTGYQGACYDRRTEELLEETASTH